MQLVPPLARAIELIATTLTIGGRIWCDPSDLLALPILLISWRVFVSNATCPGTRSAGRPRTAVSVELAQRKLTRVHKAICVLAGGCGVIACLATTVPPHPHPVREHTRFQADVYLHNATSDQIFVSELVPVADATWECEGIRYNPRKYLTEDRFESGGYWMLDPNENLPLWHLPDRPEDAWHNKCFVVGIDVEGQQVMVFWTSDDPGIRWVDLRGVPLSGSVVVEGTSDDVKLRANGNIEIFNIWPL